MNDLPAKPPVLAIAAGDPVVLLMIELNANDSSLRECSLGEKNMRSFLAIALSALLTGGYAVPIFAQTTPPAGRPMGRRLNLTPEQQAQMERIRTNTRQRVAAVLTPEQRKQYEASPRSLRSLNLTQAQREQILQIRAQARQARLNLLTPEQRARVNRLNLSDSQWQQMQRIRENTRQKILAVLTPEQRREFETANRRLRQLNLTEAQREQIRQIREQARQERLNILTPEQRQRFGK
ncbi:MAG: Spy/CpxP family protein refolding chaperone [Pseudanabaenaceae cyanobacterium]